MQSKYGEGSVFSFSIKQKIIDATPVGDIQDTLRDKKTEYKRGFTAKGAKILLVDDSNLNRKVIKSLLEQTLVEIDEASSGYECLEKAKETKYDLILLDHMMPGIDGIETLKRIKEDASNPNLDTTVIALTANALSGVREEYINAGFDGFMAKPVKPSVLEDTVQSFLPSDKIIKESV